MKLLVSLALCLNVVFSHAQSINTLKLDSLFSFMNDNGKGMNSISIFQDGKQVYTKTIGFADVDNKIVSTNNTRYRIGSITKMFTAVMIMKFIENGELSLETPLSDFYPEFNHAEKITIEQMLTHHSGLFNFTNSMDYFTWSTMRFSRAEMVEKMKNYGSSSEPGTKAEYSNTNYVLLGYIAEQLTHKTYAELLDSMICEPCGLENTYVGGKINPSDHEAYSYFKQLSWVKAPETNVSIPSGAGAIVSTPIDLNKFQFCLHGNSIVSNETLSSMKELKDGFGKGMFETPFYNKKAWGHRGGIDGFVSQTLYFPKEKVSVSILSNGQVMPLNDILMAALSIYFNMDYKIPTIDKIMEISTEALDKYLGVYASDIISLKLTISKKENVLYAQATGQQAFSLESVGNHTFVFERAGIKILFLPDEQKLILNQSGTRLEFQRISENE